MATTNDVSKAMAEAKPQASLQSMIEKSSKELGRALPEHMKPERLVRIALTNLRMNPELTKCTPESFLGALFTAAQIGIEPVGGRAYLLPFNNSRKINGEYKTQKECQFVLGYKGISELFYRHDKAVQINWGVVREGDDFEYELGTNAYLRHKPANKGGKVMGYWVMAELKGGGKPFMYMSADECLEHGKKHSKTYDAKNGKFYDSSPWAKTPEAMCLKTVLIQLAKLLPLSVELQQALEMDESSRLLRKGAIEPMDIPTTTNWNEPTPTTAEAPKEDGPEIPFGE